MENNRVEDKTGRSDIEEHDSQICLLSVAETSSALKKAIQGDESGMESVDFLAFTASMACKEPGAGSALTEKAFEETNAYYGEQYLNIENSLYKAMDRNLRASKPLSDQQRESLKGHYETLVHIELGELKDQAFRYILPSEKK